MYLYRAFQLNISSELFFPELLKNFDENLPIDLYVNYGQVPDSGLDNPIKKGLCFQINENSLWLNIPNIARFLVINGNQIIIEPFIGIDEDSIRLFLLGSCFGAILMQRNIMVLHGNAISMGKYCISITGISGAGKSTLSGAFFKRGYKILADDVCAVNNQGMVLPSFPQIKLWSDAIKLLNINSNNLRKVRPNLEKFAVPLEQSFHQESARLKLIYILNTHNKSDLKINNFVGLEKIQPIISQLYRQHYIKGLTKNKSNLIKCSNLANKIDVVKISRPDKGFCLDKLVDQIELDLASRKFDFTVV